jgi:hypothetical protein
MNEILTPAEIESSKVERFSACTPGDWEIFIQPGPAKEGLVRTVNVGPKRIATLSFVGVAESEANANLIRSAKDMFQALVAFARNWESETEEIDEQVYDLAIAALHKALGK